MPGQPPEGMGGPGEGGFGGSTPPGGGSADFEYVGATEITEASEVSGEDYASESEDESALIVNTDADVALADITVTKTGDSNGGDNCNFYGLNAALLAMGGATVTITGATITSDADGANGVFSYGGNGGRNGAAGDGGEFAGFVGRRKEKNEGSASVAKAAVAFFLALGARSRLFFRVFPAKSWRTLDFAARLR
jgi:hypothetical protein